MKRAARKLATRTAAAACLAALAAGLLAAAQTGRATGRTDWGAAGRRWWSHVEYLAADELAGRDTGSPGYRKAAEYVARQFEEAGLEPAGTSGWFQEIAFDVKQIDESRSSLELVRDGRVEALSLGDDANILVLGEPAEFVEAEAVFVGYGFAVPEMDFDELAGEDLRGKIAVYLAGAPQSLPAGPLRSHYQSAAERYAALRRAGAIGVAAIANPRLSEIPWERATLARLQPVMELADPALADRRGMQLILTVNPARADKLFAGSGHTMAEILAAAEEGKPLPKFQLPVGIRARVGLTRSRVTSPNVAGVLPGRDPALRNEYVVASAHLDHVGTGRPVGGDAIYNGAMDNASGVASLMEIARAFRDSGARPRRSVLFLALTGEEKGLLGSAYFSAYPTVAGEIVANVNLDMFLPLFALRYLQVQGLEESTLGDDIREVAAASGVEAVADLEPQANRFVRSDQYSFVRTGIPALAFKFGYRPGSREERTFRDWNRRRYHAPSDDLKQPVDRAAAAQFNHILGELLLRVADADRRPEWKQESFFRRFAAPRGAGEPVAEPASR